VNAIEREILIRIGENPDSPDVFIEGSEDMNMVRQSINDAIQEICMLSGAYRRTYLLPLRQGAQFYRMSWGLDYVGYVYQVWDRSRKWKLTSTDMLKLAAEDQLWLHRVGLPLEYFHIGWDMLGIYMKPGGDGVVLEVECVAIPADYTSSTSPVKIRNQFFHALTEFAVCEYYASRGDAKRATYHFTNYAEVVDTAKNKQEAPEQQFRYGGFRPASIDGPGQQKL
jgi:hypothetical protein